MNVFASAGFYGIGGNANMMWESYCYSNDASELEVGMLIAVQHSSYSGDGWELRKRASITFYWMSAHKY